MDLSFFGTAEAWISLVTLIFLEIVLGVDNIVFICLTSDRLPKQQQKFGRKLGLAGAFVMRSLFLCFAFALVHLTTSLFEINVGFYVHGFSVRDLVLLLGGSYLIYKGISELKDTLALTELKAEGSEEHAKKRQISLPRAVGTIMVMDIVFSIDSVITAVGLAEHLLIMILAVMLAIILMMIFIDPISDFINSNVEMKILAVVFIALIGVLLVLDSLGIGTGLELLDMPVEKLMVYFGMLLAVALTFIQISYKKKERAYLEERAREHQDACQCDACQASDGEC